MGDHNVNLGLRNPAQDIQMQKDVDNSEKDFKDKKADQQAMVEPTTKSTFQLGDPATILRQVTKRHGCELPSG